MSTGRDTPLTPLTLEAEQPGALTWSSNIALYKAGVVRTLRFFPFLSVAVIR